MELVYKEKYESQAFLLVWTFYWSAVFGHKNDVDWLTCSLCSKIEDVRAFKPFYVKFWSVFVLSKWAEFLHVVSNFIENHSPVFFFTGLHFVFE